MEKAWAYGTAIVNINTDKNYTIEDVKKMERDNLLNLIRSGDGTIHNRLTNNGKLSEICNPENLGN